MQLHAPGRCGLRVGSVGCVVAVEGRLGEEGVCKGGGAESCQPRVPGRCGLRVGGGKGVDKGVAPEPTPIHLLVLIGTTIVATGRTLRTRTKTKARGRMMQLVTLFAESHNCCHLRTYSHLHPPHPRFPHPHFIQRRAMALAGDQRRCDGHRLLPRAQRE